MKSLRWGPLLVGLAVLWNLLACSLNHGIGQGQDIQDSFRGIEWGAALEDLPLLKPLTPEGAKFPRAVRPDEDLRFGDATLDEVVYVFFEDGFGQAIATFSGEDGLYALESSFRERLGNPRVVAATGERIWTRGPVYVSLRFYRMPGQGEVNVIHRAVRKAE